jgi:murE/murF fusion protein
LSDISDELKKIKNKYPEKTSEFKIKNIAMAIKAIKLCGLKEKLIYKTIKKIKDVNGRLELIRKYPNGVKVFVDYAHTPDAMLKTLTSLKIYDEKKISIVFGCGGERDKKKRPLMARIANKYCKKIYITDDNPRNENPRKIRLELSQFIQKNKLFNIGNRALAIKKAILNAEPDEIILVAGTGHEEKQIYKNKILNISDKKIIKKINLRHKILSNKTLNILQNKLILKKIIKKKI